MLVSNRPMSFSRVRWVRSPNAADIFLILAGLAGFLILIVALGALGFGVGFKIGPIGEDYNWIDMLQSGPGAKRLDCCGRSIIAIPYLHGGTSQLETSFCALTRGCWYYVTQLQRCLRFRATFLS